MLRKRTKEEYFAKEKEIIGTSTVEYSGPVINGGEGVCGFDLDGKKFLDFTGQISLLNTGYGPEEVVSAICQQARSGVHACISVDYPFWNEIIINEKKMEVSRVALAEKLIEITDNVMPFKKRVYFEDSGGTAIDLAGKLAIIADLRAKGIKTEDYKSLFEKEIFIPSEEKICRASFLVFKNAFHGRHGLAHLLTNSKPKQLWGLTSSCAVGRLDFPAESKRWWYTEQVKDIITGLLKFAPVLGFIFEPVQCEGGVNVPNAESLKHLVGYLTTRGFPIIADEVQTGLGRTGKMWACEHFGIHPDMLVTSKSLGAGIGSVSAVIVNDQKFPDLEQGMHSGSHHASPIPVAAGIANIYKIVQEKLTDRALFYGGYTLMRLKKIAKDSGIIANVRGLGLILGIEFKSKELRNAVIKKSFEKGLLLAGCGEAAIRLTPPLIVTIPEIDQALEILQSVL